ncbi:hypothetical protein [Chromatium okenii]|jgi:hypothetical protein|uniref:Uncharacterized protein n=1 Tax=Chromatium okenii TaxID=61644 RepID=A0A2S7XSI0_9GAMM|nr:hypothetical protein [Chromatium okenii]MBV5310301.1 hypothetical protein [Chromatium okenii]PQJ96697.1 hypothetical protein CXB77_07980 [Chromatium okenii]
MNAGYLEVWADQPTAQKDCGTAGDAYGEIGQLAAGESKMLNVPLKATSAGTKLLRIAVASVISFSPLFN